MAIAVRNLDKTIFMNNYTVPNARKTNMKQMPLAIGIQGLADMMAILKVPWNSKTALKLHAMLCEAMYFMFLDNSCKIAQERKATFPDYELNGGSHIKNGFFQWEFYDKSNKAANEWMDKMEYKLRTSAGNRIPKEFVEKCRKEYIPHREWQLPSVPICGLFDWEGLRSRIKEFGVAHSLGIAFMPTASTAQLMGNFEGFEPYDALFLKRITATGEFFVVSEQLLKDLQALGLYDSQMENDIFERQGSVQGIDRIPKFIQDVYKNAYEIQNSNDGENCLLKLASVRQIFIDQGMSFSGFFRLNENSFDESASTFSSYLVHAWKKGLKTWIYYNRQRKEMLQFVSVSQKNSKENVTEEIVNETPKVCVKRPKDMKEDEICYSCS